jgi:hypothetical protein
VITAVKVGGSTGTSMTAIGSPQNMGSAIHHSYYLVNPPTGTQQIYIASSVLEWIGGASVSYAGGAAFDASKFSFTNGAANTVYSDTITIASANSWAVLLAGCEGGNITASTGSTLRQRNLSTLDNGIYDSNGQLSTGNYTMELTAGNGDWAFHMVSLPLPSSALTPDQGAMTLAGQSVRLGHAILMPDEP